MAQLYTAIQNFRTLPGESSQSNFDSKVVACVAEKKKAVKDNFGDNVELFPSLSQQNPFLL